jgi:hypothetical protein
LVSITPISLINCFVTFSLLLNISKSDKTIFKSFVLFPISFSVAAAPDGKTVGLNVIGFSLILVGKYLN